MYAEENVDRGRNYGRNILESIKLSEFSHRKDESGCFPEGKWGVRLLMQTGHLLQCNER